MVPANNAICTSLSKEQSPLNLMIEMLQSAADANKRHIHSIISTAIAVFSELAGPDQFVSVPTYLNVNDSHLFTARMHGWLKRLIFSLQHAQMSCYGVDKSSCQPLVSDDLTIIAENTWKVDDIQY